MNRLFDDDFKGTRMHQNMTNRTADDKLMNVQVSHLMTRLHVKMSEEDAHLFSGKYRAVVDGDRTVKLEEVSGRRGLRGCRPGKPYVDGSGIEYRTIQFAKVAGILPLFGPADAQILKVDGVMVLYLPEVLPAPIAKIGSLQKVSAIRTRNPDPIPSTSAVLGLPGEYLRKTHFNLEGKAACDHGGTSPITTDKDKVNCKKCIGIRAMIEQKLGELMLPEPAVLPNVVTTDPTRDEVKAAIRLINRYKRGPEGAELEMNVDACDGIIRGSFREYVE